MVYHVSDSVGVMYLGRLVEWSDKRTLFRFPRHPYTRMLNGHDPRPRQCRGGSASPVGGEVPNPIDPPPGCPFHPRCPFANDRCRTEVPQLTRSEEGSMVSCHGVEEGRIPAEDRGLKAAPQMVEEAHKVGFLNPRATLCGRRGWPDGAAPAYSRGCRRSWRRAGAKTGPGRSKRDPDFPWRSRT